MASSSSPSLVKGSLEECIAKALPTQTEMGVQNLAKTLRDIGVESPDDIQYVEATDLASVLKPVQIRKLLQQVKADLNQGAAQRMGFSSQTGQVQSSLAAFQEQGLQAQLPASLAGVCIQIPATNISSSLGMPTIPSDKVHDSIITYSEQNTPTNVLHSGSKQFPVNFNFPRSQMNSQNSDVLNYVPVPVNINQDNSSSDLGVQIPNQLGSSRPFLVEPLQIERDKTTNSKRVSPVITSFTDLSSAINKNDREIVELSPTEITTFDSSIWNFENTNKTMVSGPIIVNDDSNSSVICESPNSQNFDNSLECSVSESLNTNQHTSEFLTLHSSDNDTLVEESSDWLEKFKIPWNKMPSALMERLERRERPEQSLRREMIRVIIAEMIKLCARPTRHQLQDIAHRMVMDYPDSLLDPAENSKAQRGYNSIFKQLQVRLENINRPDRGQFNYQKKLMSYTQTRHSGKFLSNYGCINWQPLKLPPNETKWSLRLKQDLLKNIAMMPSWDVNQVTDDMFSTYFFQRKDINNGASILTLRKDWPFLFEEIGIMVHFKELTGVDLKIAIKEIINGRAKKLIDFMKTVKLAVGQVEVNKILKSLTKEGFTAEKLREVEMAAMMPLIMLFMNENKNILFPMAPKNSMSAIKALNVPETPCLVVCGDSISNSSRFVLCIDKEIVNDKITNFITGVMMLFASYYCFNIHYPVEASATLEFMQRCLVGINPANKSGNRHLLIHPKVVTLLTRLVKFGWQAPAKLQSSLSFSQESTDSGQWAASNSASTDIDLTLVCSNQNNFLKFSTDKTRDNDQMLSQSSQVLDSERLSGQNTNDGTNQQQQFSSDQMSFMVSDSPDQANDEVQCLNINQHSNQTYDMIKVALDQTKHFPGSRVLKNFPRTRQNRPRGRGGVSSRGRGSSSTSSRSRGRGTIHRRPKEWMREYWRIKKRESRARQEYWLKRMQNDVNQLNNDVSPVIENIRKTRRASSIDTCSLTLDTSNMPSSDGGPSEKVISPSVESQATLPQTQSSLTAPQPLHLSPTSSEILAEPLSVYKFELQHSDWLMARFRHLWRMRLLCNAAVGNGSANIMVHRDILLASCVKLLEEQNVDVLQSNFLQLTFTSNVKEEALWSLCNYIYEGFLILNNNIIDNMDNIGQILGIPHLLNLVAQYKKCALSDPSSNTEKDIDRSIKQELMMANSENSGLSLKPYVKMENVEATGNLPNLSQSSQMLETSVTLSTVMTGVVSTKQPDYSNTLMVVVDVEADSLSDKTSDHITRLSSSDNLLLDAGNITTTRECHQHIKHEGL